MSIRYTTKASCLCQGIELHVKAVSVTKERSLDILILKYMSEARRNCIILSDFPHL